MDSRPVKCFKCGRLLAVDIWGNAGFAASSDMRRGIEEGIEVPNVILEIKCLNCKSMNSLYVYMREGEMVG